MLNKLFDRLLVDIFIDGMEAWERGGHIDDNPYSADDERCDIWAGGFEHGQNGPVLA